MTILSVYINLSQGNKIEEELRKSANLSPEELVQLVAATKVEQKEKREKREQEEEVQFKGFLENIPSREKLLFADYQKLLKLTRLAYVREQNGVPEEHAIKLLEAFGTYEAAIEYLTKYEKANPSRPHLIHDACLFALPTDKYNVALWRELNQRYMPNELYEKTLSSASKIETYVSEHRKELENLAEQEIRSGHETRLGDEWERVQKEKETQGDVEYTQKKKKRLEKKITEMVDKQIANKAFKKIQSEPEIFKGLGKLEALKKFRESDEGKKLRKELTDTIRAEQEALQEEYEKTQLSANVAKQEYIKNKLDDPKLKKIIEGNIKDAKKRVLSENTSVETLFGYLSQCSYKNAGQNPKAAAAFFQYGLSEKQFEKYLALKISETSNIPDVFIDGEDIGYPGFYLKKLSKTDPTCAIAGKMTSCCQWMGGAGGACAIHAITSPNGDIFGLYQKKGAQPGDDDILLSLTWAWLSPNNNIVFDSIESQIDFLRKNERMLSDFFVLLAHKLVTENGIPKVHLGKGASPDELIVFTIESDTPKDYWGYRDSFSQSLLSSPIFLKYYLLLNEDSKLQKILKDLPSPTEEEISKIGNSLLPIAAENNNRELVRYLIKHGADVNARIDYGKTPLEWALERNDLEQIKFLLNHGAKIYHGDAHVFGALRDAVENNHREMVHYLIEHGADANTKIDGYDKTLLFWAVERGDLEQIKFLLNHGAKINYQDVDGNSVLSIAVDNNDREMVRFLIKHGASLYKKNKSGKCAMSLANNEMLKFLIDELGADSNKAKGSMNQTPLHIAARKKDFAFVKFLVEKGANINQVDSDGQTALHIATMEPDNVEILKYLVAEGANIFLHNDKGQTAIEAAIAKKEEDRQKYYSLPDNFDSNLDYLREVEKLKIEKQPKDYELNKKFFAAIFEKNLKEAIDCIEQGFQTSDLAKSELMLLALNQGNLSDIKYLVENKGIDLKKLTLNPEFDPINIAISKNDLDLVKYLVRTKKLDLKSPDHLMKALYGYSPNIGVVKFLVEEGIDLNRFDNRDNNALTRAVAIGDFELVKYLVEHGANISLVPEPDFDTSRFNINDITSDKEKFLSNIEFLIKDLKINVNITYGNQSTFFTRAAEYGNLSAMQFLIDHGANIDHKNHFGETALSHAVKRNDEKVVKFLLDHSADPYQKSGYGESAFDRVNNDYWKKMNENIVKMILEKDKELKEKSELPLSAFDLAKRRNKEEKERETKAADEGPETGGDRSHHLE